MKGSASPARRRFHCSLTLVALTIATGGLAGCLSGPRATPPGDSAAPAPMQGEAKVTAIKGRAEYSPGALALTLTESGTALFDGKTLAGWKITDFAGGGDVRVENGEIILGSGVALTGITWTNPLPKTNYEVSLEARKIEGTDFFCGLTFPVAESHATLIAGGWGGAVVGISSIDSADASENETTKFMSFDKGRWYRFRVRVTPAKIEAWIDNEKLVDQSIEGRRVGMRPGEIELSVPFGIATYQTTSAVRNIKIRKSDGP